MSFEIGKKYKVDNDNSWHYGDTGTLIHIRPDDMLEADGHTWSKYWIQLDLNDGDADAKRAYGFDASELVEIEDEG